MCSMLITFVQVAMLVSILAMQCEGYHALLSNCTSYSTNNV